MAVLTSTATVTVNPAFLQEIKEVNQELWQSVTDLRHRCSRPIATGMCRHLVDWLSELRDQLALHFALEEAYGYFDEPLHVAPQLAEKADGLRSEHQELYSEFSEIVDRAEKMFYAGQAAALALWVGPRFLDFDARLRDHEDRENELIYDAFDSDIGCGD
ncbi:MAG: hemerythrin domain-containing protein [Pirellulaceae bacterium]